ncbi:hypothetical protein BOTBODRAFT_175448 [Botryobasidium botryosum FD-172 SS1]|uniref:Uncharacterized protein n=1 Tax=Botryobasidium botryosum (strain FD-172 SS1) TaxID=930990 RepID=A0A067MCE8_BOTB1|nr:hypothetical protein BOTBODRAFT_175448 [Botryobasidium botryosum FD-172 SS1]
MFSLASIPATPPAFDLQPVDMPYYNAMTTGSPAIRPLTYGTTNRDGTPPSPHRYSRSATSPIPLQRLDYTHGGSQSRTVYPGDWPLTDISTFGSPIYPHGHTTRAASLRTKVHARDDTPTSDWAEEHDTMSLSSVPSHSGSSIGVDDPSLMSHSRLLSTYLELRGQFNSLRKAHALLVNAVGAKMDMMEHSDAVHHSQSTPHDTKTDSLLPDADGLTQKECLLLNALDSKLYPRVKYWFKAALADWVEDKKEKKCHGATTFGEQELWRTFCTFIQF